MPWLKDKDGLTRKQKAFADKLLDNPKMSTTQAVKETYDTTDYSTAAMIGSENLNKPKIMTYLQKHSKQAEHTMLKVMGYSEEFGETFSPEGAKYAAVAVSAAKDVLDRVHGKPTQRVEQQSTTVTLALSLTDSREKEANASDTNR
jgi:phage terminase small subunit